LAALFAEGEFVALDWPTRRTVLGVYPLHNMDIEADIVAPPLGAELRRNSQVGAVYVAMLAVASDHEWEGTRLTAGGERVKASQALGRRFWHLGGRS